MRIAVFIGAAIVMFLGVGVFTGVVGTLERHSFDQITQSDTATYNVCAQFNSSLHCLRVTEGIMHFLNTVLAMPQLHTAAPFTPQHGNTYY